MQIDNAQRAFLIWAMNKHHLKISIHKEIVMYRTIMNDAYDDDDKKHLNWVRDKYQTDFERYLDSIGEITQVKSQHVS